MHAWIIEDHVRQRCRELRAEARRERLAREKPAAERTGLRHHIANGLFAAGSLLVSAAGRISGDVTAGERIVA